MLINAIWYLPWRIGNLFIDINMVLLALRSPATIHSMKYLPKDTPAESYLCAAIVFLISFRPSTQYVIAIRISGLNISMSHIVKTHNQNWLIPPNVMHRNETKSPFNCEETAKTHMKRSKAAQNVDKRRRNCEKWTKAVKKASTKQKSIELMIKPQQSL